jgi:hypothetical protein
MRHRLIITTLALAISATSASAQVIVDMSRYTCAQYLAMPPATAQNFAAWMSGWFAYQERRTFVDVTLHQKNVESLRSWCQTHPQETLMGALKGAIGLK